MFSKAVRGGKAFAAKQKIRDLKKRIFRINAREKKVLKEISSYETTKKQSTVCQQPNTSKFQMISKKIA